MSGVTNVTGNTFIHYYATCSCGWSSRRHVQIQAAQADAWGHCAEQGCHPAIPYTLGEMP